MVHSLTTEQADITEIMRKKCSKCDIVFDKLKYLKSTYEFNTFYAPSHLMETNCLS